MLIENHTSPAMQTLSPYNRSDYNNLPSQFPPDYASAWGEDQCGIWFELDVNGVVQRFRWIPRGEFTMGAPVDEKQRDADRETLHEVTLTQGFWLADTACTQELWQSIMSSNPASFNDDPQNPVERVSWLDVQDFLHKLKQLMPDLNVGLPTEAQWEYACRAGTTTAFSFGDNITPEQVNYDGNHPYADGKKGLYREKTVAVDALPANQWGVYQMHGNVWEWCFDEWQDDLGIEAAVDPVTARFKSGVKPDKAGAATGNTDSTPDMPAIYDSAMLENAEDVVLRVLRGGSWNSLGRNCRSAIRFRLNADNRRRDLGFRLAIGH